MEREFLGVWLPKEIYLHKELTPTEKLLMAEIMSFSKNGVCFASNEHFAEFLGVSKRHVSRMIGNFVKLGLVKIDLTYKEDTQEIDKRFITPVLKQDSTPLSTLTQEHTPVVIQDDTPIDINVHTPRHECPDPLDVDVLTPTTQMSIPPRHECPDPMDIDVYYKEHIKEQDKEQYKIQDKDIKNIMLISNETSKKATQLESEFERLWKLYPRKEGRKKALESFKKARKDKKVPYETIENGLYRYLRYIEQQDTDSQYIPHGSTWFSQHRWQDEYAIQARKKPKNHFEYLQMKYGGMDYEPNGNGETFDDYSKVISDPFQGL